MDNPSSFSQYTFNWYPTGHDARQTACSVLDVDHELTSRHIDEKAFFGLFFRILKVPFYFSAEKFLEACSFMPHKCRRGALLSSNGRGSPISSSVHLNFRTVASIMYQRAPSCPLRRNLACVGGILAALEYVANPINQPALRAYLSQPSQSWRYGSISTFR